MLKKKKLCRGAAAVAAVVLAASVLAPVITREGEKRADIVFIDVGQGDAIHLRTPEGKNILIDSGGSSHYDVGKKTLLPYFLKNGVGKLDLALITHLHQDHYGGLISLSEYIKVDKLGIYEGNYLRQDVIAEETGLSPEQFAYLGKGDKIMLGEEIWVEVLWPAKRSESEYASLLEQEGDENSSSLILKIHWQGTAILITGDLGIEGEEEIIKEMKKVGRLEGLRADVLKVGHHGSRYSSGQEFLEAAAPRIAVIQVGKNNFGHPHPDALERIENAGAVIRRNDLEGAILIDILGSDIRIRSMI